MPKDTKTRYQGVYARHKTGCGVELDRRCNCSPSYWGSAYDRRVKKRRPTAFLSSAIEARNARDDLRTALRECTLPAGRSMLLEDAVESFLAMVETGTALNKHGRKYTPKTLIDLRGALRGHVAKDIGALSITEVRRRHVQEIIDSRTHLSGSRVRTIVSSVSSLYRWARAREIAHHEPAEMVQLPALDPNPRDHVVAPSEFAALLDELDADDAIVFAIAGYTTARLSEIRYALVEDVDLDLEVIYLGSDEENGRKSRAAERPVPIVDQLLPYLRRAVEGRDPAERLCPPRRKCASGLLCMRGVQRRADRLWETAGLKRITFHEARHTCISWLDAAEVRGVVRSWIAGHETPRLQDGAARITQERYTHMLPGDLQRALKQFNAYLRRELGGNSR
jgi:integrase